MSLPIDDTLDILRGHLTDATLLQRIGRDLLKAEQEAKASKASAGPAAKTRLVVLIRGDASLKPLVAGGAFVVSVPDDSSTATYSDQSLLARLRKAVVEQNDAPVKRRSKARQRIETWFQAFTGLRAKSLKQSGSPIGIKQKGRPAECVVLETEAVQP